MKTITFVLLLFLTGLDLMAQIPPAPRRLPPGLQPAANTAAKPQTPGPATPAVAPAVAQSPSSNTSSSADSSDSGKQEEMIPAGNIDFQGVDVSQVLDVYAKLVGRTVLRAGLPNAQIVLKTETPLTKTEAIQALQGVLALNGIELINVGDKFVKAMPMDQAKSAGGGFSQLSASNLPDVGSYVTRIVQLKYMKPTDMVPIIQPFARLPDAILPIDDNNILVLRDNAENVKRMLEMIKKVDVPVPDEYISEVIPIKYALADDIANALNSLASGGKSITIGNQSRSSSSINGLNRGSSNNNYQNNNNVNGLNSNQNRPFATTTPVGNTFQDRLRNIIQRASSGGQNQIQILGQTEIIADERSNSLLVFATRQDMAMITNIVAKLDVLLPQVLIQSVIMDVTLGSGWNFGLSAAQNPQVYSPGQQIAGGGGINNGPSFLSFLSNAPAYFSAGTNAATTLAGGLSYFGNIGPNWDVALQAAASANNVTVIQRPSVVTSQAKPASFFDGETVPYVTSTYYGGAGYGNSSSYSQLSVGVELDVTPFINPNGLVVMDIKQEIDGLNGYTTIEGVGDVPNTTQRSLTSEVAVRNRDTILLGGFIKTDKSQSKSGVPLLEDIPLLGDLFSSRSDSKDRQETVVMIRPTVLKTPELLAEQTMKEQESLPGVSAAIRQDEEERQKLIEANHKQNRRYNSSENQNAGFFSSDDTTNMVPEENNANDGF
jgi:general secretion pathway protein D